MRLFRWYRGICFRLFYKPFSKYKCFRKHMGGFWHYYDRGDIPSVWFWDEEPSADFWIYKNYEVEDYT